MGAVHVAAPFRGAENFTNWGGPKTRFPLQESISKRIRPGTEQTSERARHDGLGPVQNLWIETAVEKCVVGWWKRRPLNQLDNPFNECMT